MPREVRRIVFSHSETASAIINYGKKFNMSFPENGKLLKAVYSTAPEFEISAIKQMQESHQVADHKPRPVILSFFDHKTLEHKYFTLPDEFILSALKEYCMEQKILLPKTAKKALDVTEFNVVLDLSTESEEQGLSLED